MRLFVGVRPPAEVCAQLAAALGGDADPRWHVTLAFLGERPDPEPVLEALRPVAARHGPVPLRLSGGGTFGARVLWAGVAGRLAPLARDVQVALGIPEQRPFHAHVTVRRGHGLIIPRALSELAGEQWTADEIELVLSRYTSHQVLERLPLRG
ncbi:MAG: 2'-5' RNA ligase family protein [Mycobacteriales bacterium]